MRKPKPLLRLVGGAVLSLGLGACATDPVAPTDAPALVKGGVTFTEFSATSVTTGLVDPGSQKVEDGVVETRGLMLRGSLIGPTPALSCNWVVELNSDLLLSNATGPLWGKMLECVTADGGVWAGSFDGYRTLTFTPGPTWVVTLKLVFRGVSGPALGYQVRATQVATSTVPTELGNPSTITGVLFNPNPR